MAIRLRTINPTDIHPSVRYLPRHRAEVRVDSPSTAPIRYNLRDGEGSIINPLVVGTLEAWRLVEWADRLMPQHGPHTCRIIRDGRHSR